MPKRLLFLPALVAAAALRAQTADPGVEIANLREDVNGLSQRLGDLNLRVEQLEAQNAALRDQAKSAGQNAVTIAQLNAAIADINSRIDAEMEKLEGSSGSAGPHAPAQPGFSEDFPKVGVSYTVQRGDTLALIAKKTGARLSDIINANKIADPSRIQAGQALFIPGGK
jgi:nucleoid-associated protein YgaU